MLARRRLWDPVTRQPLGRHQLVANHALKAVTEDFVRKNPWAFGQ